MKSRFDSVSDVSSEWTESLLKMLKQQNSHKLQCSSGDHRQEFRLDEGNVNDVAMYRRYIKPTHRQKLPIQLREHIRHIPFCSDPKTKKVGWIQFHQCDRWCHCACIPVGRGRPGRFVCVICQCRE